MDVEAEVNPRPTWSVTVSFAEFFAESAGTVTFLSSRDSDRFIERPTAGIVPSE